MENTVVITPTSEPTPEPSMADLRKMFETDTASETEVKTETSVTPPAEKSAEPEQPKAESETASQEPTEQKTEKTESAIDKRFSKLAKQRDEAREEAAKLRRELEAKSTPPGPVEPAETVTPAGKPTPPDISTWTGTYEALEQAKLDYAEKLADWKVEQALAKRDQKASELQAAAEHKTIQDKWDERAAQAVKDNPDFLDAMKEIGSFVTRAGVAKLVMQSEVGPQIVQYMYDHMDETGAMARLGDPLLIAREIGRLETKLTPAPKQSPTVAKPLPKPPASIDATSAPAPVDLNTADMRSFKREVMKQL